MAHTAGGFTWVDTDGFFHKVTYRVDDFGGGYDPVIYDPVPAVDVDLTADLLTEIQYPPVPLK